MKTIKMLAALAFPVMFAACANEEIIVDTPQELDKVVGTKLIGTDISMNASMYDGAESRMNDAGLFTTDDLLGLGWIVNGGAFTDQLSTSAPNVSALYANHMFSWSEDLKRFTTYGNVYQGWHFAYYPYEHMAKIGEKKITINPAQTSKEWSDRLGQNFRISALQFIDDKCLEDNALKNEFELLNTVNTILLNTTAKEGSAFAEGGSLANLNIQSVKFDLGYKVFAKEATLDAKNLPAAASLAEVNDLRDYFYAETNPVIKVANWNTTITTDVAAAGYVVSEDAHLMTLVAPKSNKNVVKEKAKIEIVAGAGKFTIEYVDEASDKYNEDAAFNNTAIEALVAAYLKDGAMASFTTTPLTLNVKLYGDIFEADFGHITNYSEWVSAVELATALGRTEQDFGVDGAIDFAGTIPMPENCEVTVKYVTPEDPLVAPALNITKNLKSWPTNLISEIQVVNNKTISDATGITGDPIINKGKMTLPTLAEGINTIASPVINEGIITLKNGTKLEDVDNDGRINIYYGAKVTVTGDEGVIAYTIVNNEKAFKINNIIAGTNGVKVNTLVIPNGKTFNINMIDAAGVDSNDPYVTIPGAVAVQLDALDDVNIEMMGGNLEVGEVPAGFTPKNTVKGVNVLEGVNTISAETLVGNVTVENGATLAMSIDQISGDLTNKGVITLNSEKTIKINNIVNNGGELTSNNDIEVNNVTLMNKSVTTLGEEWDKTIWYIGNYVHSNSSVNGYVNKFTAGGTTVSELTSAISAVEEGGVVKLSGDITLSSPADLASSKAYTLNLNGYKLKLATLPNTPIDTKLNIANGTVASQLYMNGVLTAENVTFEINSKIGSTEGAIQLRGNNNATFKNCTFKVKDGMSALVTEHGGFGGVLTLDGCTFKKSNKSIFINPLSSNPSAKVIVTNSVFEDDFTCEFYNEENQFIIIGNTFNGLFGVADGCPTISGMSTASKIFCNELLDNNEFKGANKIVVGWPIDGYINNKF